MAEITLTDEGKRALREAENFCWKLDVGILAAEHLLGGALLVLGGREGVPDAAAIEEGLVAVHGRGSTTLEGNVMWGSSARDALNETARQLQEAGGTELTPGVIARGLLESGELNPMVYGGMGTTKESLRAALAEAG
jgi:hypothetical protein